MGICGSGWQEGWPQTFAVAEEEPLAKGQRGRPAIRTQAGRLGLPAPRVLSWTMPLSTGSRAQAWPEPGIGHAQSLLCRQGPRSQSFSPRLGKGGAETQQGLLGSFEQSVSHTGRAACLPGLFG